MAALFGAIQWPWQAGMAMATLALPFAKKMNDRGTRGIISSIKNLDANIGQYHEPDYCPLCSGEGTIPCKVCRETGSLARGGFTKKNSIRIASLVGSKWTSVSAINGKWRHFLCTGKKGKNTKDAVAILSSTCGPVENRIKMEIPLKQLKSRELWDGGWTTLNDIHAGGGLPGTACSACRGEKTVMCPRCDGLGQLGL